MTEAVFAVPGDLDTPTGGYIYDRRVLALLPAQGVRAHHLALPASFPDPGEADLAESLRRIRAAPEGVLMIDGLAYGAMPLALIAEIARPIVALVHHPLGLETGLTAARREALIASERAALAAARRVIVTSENTARILASQFGVSRGIVAVAEPGVDPAPCAPRRGDPVRILSAGAVTPRKGYDALAAALARLADLPWKAKIAGALDRAPSHVEALRVQIARAGLEDRIALAGSLDAQALERAYMAADLFVLPSHYEGYGMAAAEALAHGLPLVLTRGAFGFAPPEEAAAYVPPGDADALAACLRRLIEDAPARRKLGDAAWAHARNLPRWEETAAIIADVIKKAAGDRAS